MKTITFTWADLQAENLLIKAGIVPMTTKQHLPTQSGDYIIAMAEKIKANGWHWLCEKCGFIWNHSRSCNRHKIVCGAYFE